MKLLRLTPALKATSAPYNQFSLGFKDKFEQTVFSLNAYHDVSIDEKIEVFHGDGSVFKAFRILRKLVSENRYDIVHIHNGVTGLIFVLALLPFNLALLRKSVFTLHNSWYVLKRRNRLFNLAMMSMVKSACTCGNASYESVPQVIKFLVGKKLVPVVNGFNHDRIDNVEKLEREKNFPDTSSLKIVYVGALNNTKNQIELLEALRYTDITAQIIFLGDGQNRDKLVTLSKSLPDSLSISFKGLVERDIAIAHMLEADVCVSLSKGEGLPIAVLEAMYAGCFLILSSIPPHREVAPPKERSIFVDMRKRMQVVDALNSVANNLNEIRQGRTLSKDYSISNFSMQKMLLGYERIYRAL